MDINSFHFIDSAAFLGAPLAELAGELGKDHPFKILDQMELYRKPKSSRKKLLLKKGTFPYEYFSCSEKLNEATLPSKDSFFSLLTNSHITDEEYAHAHNVFKKFKCRTFKDYVEIYCATDTALLAEVFCHFRNEIFKEHALDVCRYVVNSLKR